MKQILKNTFILTMITLIAGVSLGFVFELTKEPIAKANEAAKQEACKSVFAEADSFEKMEVTEGGADEAYIAMKGSDELGYVITTTSKNGYSGDIQVSVGIAASGEVKGLAIITINETPGLGMKAKDAEFRDQYAGKTTEHFFVDKDGGEGEQIDSISGATITTRAVTDAVNMALDYYYDVLGGIVNE